MLDTLGKILLWSRINLMDTTATKLQKFFESLLILYADSNPHTARSMMGQFKSVGLSNVIALQNSEEWDQSLSNKSLFPDLIIVDRDFFGEQAVDRIEAIRHGKIGFNPFIPIIGTISEAKQSEVMSFIRSGIDEILIRPLAIATILKRLNNFSRGRKPFIATMDYIGPDRRTREQRVAKKEDKAVEQSPERLVDPRPVAVPNSLKLKADKSYDFDSFSASLNKTQKEIYSEVLRGCIFQLIFNSIALSEASSYDLNKETVAKHADAISENIDLTAVMAQKANVLDARFMRTLNDVRQTHQSGISDDGFNLNVSQKLIDAATELALVVYKQNPPYPVITEIRESAQKFMTKFYRNKAKPA